MISVMLGMSSHMITPAREDRWGEDGPAGISDDHQYLCFARALCNGKDSIVG